MSLVQSTVVPLLRFPWNVCLEQLSLEHDTNHLRIWWAVFLSSTGNWPYYRVCDIYEWGIFCHISIVFYIVFFPFIMSFYKWLVCHPHMHCYGQDLQNSIYSHLILSISIGLSFICSFLKKYDFFCSSSG